MEPSDPILKQVCRPVQPGEPIDEICKIMERVCHRGSVKGAGLAAPQIGHAIQLIYIDGPTIHQRQGIFLINPVLDSHTMSSQTSLSEEGCLSYPGAAKVIARPVRFHVSYTTLQRRPWGQWFEGYAARVVHHELDHLVGRCRVGDDSPADGVMPPKPEPRRYRGNPLLLAALVASMPLPRR